MGQDPVVVVGAKRTPLGGFRGIFQGVCAVELGARALGGALDQSGASVTEVSHVLMGCVLSAALGQGPGRQAALKAGLPPSVPGTVVNKVCGSSLQAIFHGVQELLCQESGPVVLAGGMENMSRAPYLLMDVRRGLGVGHGQMLDHIFWDGLEDSNSHQVMGKIAEKTAVKYNLSRKVQDAYAQETCKRALQTLKDGGFEREIVSVPLPEGSIHHDEFPARLKLEKIERLKPAFLPEGTITAATSSSLADGAAAVALTRLSTARGRNFKPLALIRGVACHAQEPDWFTTAPIQAITKVASQVGWLLNEVDLFEVNEAFAVVPLAVMQALHIPHAKMNVLGGACAMGHPLGASGARILVTLLNALHQHQHKRGIAAICIGGGEALAVAVEVPDGSF